MRTRAKQGNDRQQRSASTDDAQRDCLECARGGSGQTDQCHPRGGTSVGMDASARRGERGPCGGAHQDRDIGGQEKRQRGQGHEKAAPGAPRERERSDGQRPRCTAGQDDQREASASCVDATRCQGRGLNAGGTRHEQRLGRADAERSDNGQHDVSEGPGEDAVGCTQHQCGRDSPGERGEETHSQRGTQATARDPGNHRGERTGGHKQECRERSGGDS